MGCCDSGAGKYWGIFALLAVSAVVFTSVSTPAYFGVLVDKSDPEAFKGCAHCIQDFGIEVLKSVNATDIADKLEKIHERNQKNHPHHGHHHHHHHHTEDEGFDFDEDECITGKDLESLKPDLEGLVIPEWKEQCKDICTPVLKTVPLAATVSGVLLFVGLISAICSIIPLCLLCCRTKERSPAAVVQQWQANYGVPSASPVGTYQAVAEAVAEPTEDAKQPLLNKF